MSRQGVIVGAWLMLLLTSAALGLAYGLEASVVPIGVGTSALFVAMLYVYVLTRPPVVSRKMIDRTGPVVASPQADRRAASTASDLRTLIILAIGIRIFVGLVLNLTKLSLSLAPDSWAYFYYGLRIAEAWVDPRVDPNELAAYDPLSFYQQFNAVAAAFAGKGAIYVTSIINAFIGVWGAWLVGRIAGDLYGPVAQRRAFILSAFFPSLILWTSINLRDGWSFVAISGAILCGNRLRHKWTSRDFVFFLMCMGFLPFLRWYMLVLVSVGILASFVIVRIRHIPYVILSGILLVGFFYGVNKTFNLRVDLGSATANLATMQKMKEGLSSAESDASYQQDADISTPVGAILYLPKGVAYFLFSPFPWRVRKPRQLFAFAENVVWMVLFVGACQMIWKGMKTRISAVALPVCVAGIIAIAYGLVEGNEGTAFRHRAHVLLVMFVFAAGKHAERQKAAREVFRVTDGGGNALPEAPAVEARPIRAI